MVYDLLTGGFGDAIALVGLALLVWVVVRPNMRSGLRVALLGAGLAALPRSFFTSPFTDLAYGISDIVPFDNGWVEGIFGGLLLAGLFALALLLGWRAWPAHLAQSRILGFACILAIAASLAAFWEGTGQGSFEGPRAVNLIAALALVWLFRRRLLATGPAGADASRRNPTSHFDEMDGVLRPAPEEHLPPSPAAAMLAPPSDVFISYKREERTRVEEIANALRALKLSVWFDARLQTGHSFDAEINREVRAARCVLVCWSPGAVASEWVRAEAAIGRQRGVLAACFLEACELYPPFNLIHAEDLSGGSFDAGNPAWVKVVDQIGRLAGRSGLGAYLCLGGDRTAQGVWVAENPNDPLVDVLLAQLRGA